MTQNELNIVQILGVIIMRLTTFLSAAVITFAVSTGAASAADDFATLKGVKAAPMAASELQAVKGLHIHFLDANGGFHLAGNPANKGIGTGNWYLNGSPDGDPVHPSYHGLCVAGPITIPPVGPGGVPTLSQCP